MAEGRWVLPEVEWVEITTLCDNLVDLTAPDMGPAKRLRPDKSDARSWPLLTRALQRDFVAEHGLSMAMSVSDGQKTRSLLFDTGGSPYGLVENLQRLQVDPRQFSAIALSHGHWDHVVGLVGLLERLGRRAMPLLLHPEAFLTRASLTDSGEIDDTRPQLSRQALRDTGLEVVESSEPSYLLERMLLVSGQVARTNDFETGYPRFLADRGAGWEPDPLICDDQCVIANLQGKGLVIVTGCGHAGIVNTIEHARAITGVDRVHAILGGFHLGPKHFHPKVGRVVEALRALQPSYLVAAHCTGVVATHALMAAMPEACIQNTVGTRYTFQA